HPAFVYGHLALYPARMLGFVGVDASKVAVPAHYPDVFKAGVECKDDPEGTIYPEREEILEQFYRNYDGVFAELTKLDDAVLLKPHPDEMIREKYFPTIGNALTFMLNNHVMMHLGQISTWRRCFGLPSAM
ncbi:MAG: DinB family protein, partial [Planctomycetota bacterium]